MLETRPANPGADELRWFCGTTPEAAWLQKHRLLPRASTPYTVRTNRGWEQSGDSATLDFSLIIGNREQRYITKSCLKSSSSATMREWLQRRERISRAGLSTPALHAHKQASIIESYVPYTLAEAFTRANEKRRQGLVAGFIATHVKLAELGFRPVSLHDVRSHGEDVTLIDFGSDLGGPRQARPAAEAIQLAHAELPRIIGSRFASRYLA